MASIPAPASKMDIWGYLSIAAWILFAAILVFGVASYSKLQSQISQLQSLNELERLRSAERDSQLDALDEMSHESLEFLKERTGQLAGLVKYCDDHPTQDAGLANLCSAAKSATQANYAGYLSKLQDATASRGRAEFEDSVNKYAEVLRAVDEVSDFGAEISGEPALRKMLALEGQAYGLYRQGRLKAARHKIDAALQLQDPQAGAVSGFVLSTDLKILCKSEQKGIDPAAKYAEDRSVLDAVAEAEMNKPIWYDYRKRDRGYFETDQELKLVCSLS